jgi:AraC-like DNA-binding protein
MQSNDTIANIAFESGFENTTHFCRLFKQKTGNTPMEYRKRIVERVFLTA